MDQKNTIVKCKAHPDCLFNYNGVCDNYVINIGADGKCECYVETASEEETKRGQRAKCNILDDACDLTFCKPNCIFCTIEKDSYYCMLKQCRIDGFGFRCLKYREEKNEV